MHVYTERQNGQSVTTYHRLYSRNKNNEMELVIEPAIIEDKLRLGERFNNGVLETFAGRQRLFVCYLPNNPTFMNEEINKISYVHVYTERQNGQSVTTYHRLYSRNKTMKWS